MAYQMELFEVPLVLPPGLRYQRQWISPSEENELLGEICQLPFKDFEYHAYTGKRRTVSFGWSYDFVHEKLEKAEEIPGFLLPLRESAAAFARLSSKELEQVLVTEYSPQAGIGWHRDKGAFEQVIGVSLLAPCQFRLRRKNGGKWERATINVEPRSIYLLSGPARTQWEHSIPPVDELRYSITFRSLRSS